MSCGLKKYLCSSLSSISVFAGRVGTMWEFSALLASQGGGGLPYITDGDARRNFKTNP